MTERDFSRFGNGTAADKTGSGYSMVRTAERPFHKPVFTMKEAGYTVYLGHFQRFFQIHGRQYRRYTLSQHGLTGTRRTYHKQVMTACSGNFQGPLGNELPLNLTEIDIITR